MIDFPIPTFIGQKFNTGTGAIYVWDGVAWSLDTSQTKTAREFNRVVNPSVSLSQENGTNSVSTNGAFPVDQWMLGFTGFAGQAVQTATFVSPDGSPNSLIASFSVTRPSPAAGDYAQIFQPVEGYRVADFCWGTANAKPAVLRFNAACEVAGTYCASISSSNGDYSWIGEFVCDGSTAMKTFSYAIPAQQAGTWYKDNRGGLLIHFCQAVGSTYGGGVKGWQNANKLATAAQTNGATIINKNLIITDVGLYIDPDNTGLPPPWEPTDLVQNLLDCQRYWRLSMLRGSGYGNAAYAGLVMPLSPWMRTTPTGSFTDLAGQASKISIAGVNGIGVSGGGLILAPEVFGVDMVPAQGINNTWWGARIIMNARM